MVQSKYVLANYHINHQVFSICFVFSFQFFLQLLFVSLVLLIFRSSVQIMLENTLFCQQNVRLKNRLFYSKFCRQNLSKPSWKFVAETEKIDVEYLQLSFWSLELRTFVRSKIYEF